MRKAFYGVLLIALLESIALVVTAFGYANAARTEAAELRDKLAEAQERKVLVIEQPVPQGMAAVEEAYTPVPKTTTYHGQTVEIVPPSESIGAKPIGEFKVTHYCSCALCCGKSDGVSASGREVIPYYSIAVDPSVIPLGSIVYLDYGDGVLHEARADDIGGAICGNVIDLCVGDHETARQMGIRSATVYLVEGKK